MKDRVHLLVHVVPVTRAVTILYPLNMQKVHKHKHKLCGCCA